MIKPQNAAGEGKPTTPAEKVPPRANMGPLRASVRCRDCQHFTPDTINPPQGLGRCAVTLTGLPPAPVRGYAACYPMALRQCPNFEGIES